MRIFLDSTRGGGGGGERGGARGVCSVHSYHHLRVPHTFSRVLFVAFTLCENKIFHDASTKTTMPFLRLRVSFTLRPSRPIDLIRNALEYLLCEQSHQRNFLVAT